MSFISSYKHLEKLCGDMLNDSRRISAYIDEMQNTPQGAYYVPSWNEDLKKLKHYRWVRNQIVHEPDCNKENTCEPGDALWLNQFYACIMNQTDPLSLYHKAIMSCPEAQLYRTTTYSAAQSDQRQVSRRLIRCIIVLLIVFIILLLIAFCFALILRPS